MNSIKVELSNDISSEFDIEIFVMEGRYRRNIENPQSEAGNCMTEWINIYIRTNIQTQKLIMNIR